MKAITLTQPWASLMAVGAKVIETRGWSTQYRGPIAIHAAKGFPGDARWECWEPPFRSVLEDAGLVDFGRYEDLGSGSIERFHDLPLGQIIAVGNIVNCLPTSMLVSFFASRSDLVEPIGGIIPRRHEYDFGNYGSRRYGFLFDRVRKLDTPIPCRGQLGLWEVPDDVAAQVPA